MKFENRIIEFLNMENWKKIIMKDVEYEYEISDLGNVRNSTSGIQLSPYLNTNGYLYCRLYNSQFEKGSKDFKIHRLGATMFIPNPENKLYVNHINHNKQDNRIVNLEWSTHPENVEHAYTNEDRKSTGKPIILYEQDCITPIQRYDSIRDAAKELGIPEKNIGPVLSGRIKHTGEQKYHFKYATPKEIITEEQLKEFEEIKDYSNYMIHRDGRIYNKKRKIFMAGRLASSYLYVAFKEHNHAIHRLVAIQFLPNPDNKKFVNHKDGNKLNNHVDNLEWTTKSENNQHAYDTGLNPNVVAVKQYKMDGTFVATHKSISDACRIINIDPELCGSTITDCCRYKIKHAYNFIWRYETDTSPVEAISILTRNGRKKVSQYTLEGVHVRDYDMVADAAEVVTGKRRYMTYISQCCKGKIEQAHGFIFKFKED